MTDRTKHIFFFMAILVSSFFSSCNKYSDQAVSKYEYHAHIVYPYMSRVNLMDSLPIHIVFESHSGESIQNILITIEEKHTGIIIYSEPLSPTIHSESSSYHFKDKIKLDATSGFKKHTEYILRAKVWGKDMDEEEEETFVEFEVLS